MFCKKCGKTLDEDARFCAYCGEPVSEADTSIAKSLEKSPPVQKRKPILIGIVLGLVLTAVCSPLVLITRGRILASPLNPEQREVSGIPTEDQAPSQPAPQDQPVSESLPGQPLVFPDIPLVYASDRGAPNYDECHPDSSCVLQVFYNPAPLTESAINLTGPLGFAAASEPVLSPDGRQVAFTGFVEGAAENHVYIVNIDGSGMRVMTLKGYNHGHPSWSPDGRSLVVMSRPTGEDGYHLYRIDVESREASQLTFGSFMDRFPDWSPDGRWIAFHSSRADPNPETCWPNCLTSVYFYNIAEGQVYSLGSGEESISGGGFAWSPDSSRLAFHSSQSGSWDIYLVDLEGSIVQLTSDPGDEVFPAWSPDGKFLAYAQDSADGRDIIVTPVEYFDPVDYTSDAAFDYYPDW
ncbi:MAG: zinc-ribbon domain-containing protein [Anaerolineales bacterium]